MIRSGANFNIAPNQRVQFLQPSSSAFALNRVLSSDPTAIFGQLLANGQIVLINPNGITFGAGAQVNVGALAASTLNISDADFLRGTSSGQFTFFGASNGRIVNHGAINAGHGGYVALMAKQVSNQGLLNAPRGTVALAVGERVSLSHAGGLLNFGVVGKSGAGNGTGNAGAIVQSGARISATNGALNVAGTRIGTGDQAIGVLVSGANSRIDSVGNGAMTIIGQGSSAVGATNAAGVSIANSGSLLGKDGATSLVGVGGTNSDGVQIDNATVGANGLESFTIVAQGDGIAAGLTTSGLQPILLADQGGR